MQITVTIKETDGCTYLVEGARIESGFAPTLVDQREFATLAEAEEQARQALDTLVDVRSQTTATA